MEKQTFDCLKKGCVGKAVSGYLEIGEHKPCKKHRIALRCNNWHWYVYSVCVDGPRDNQESGIILKMAGPVLPEFGKPDTAAVE
jgi:hypothetical protein